MPHLGNEWVRWFGMLLVVGLALWLAWQLLGFGRPR